MLKVISKGDCPFLESRNQQSEDVHCLCRSHISTGRRSNKDHAYPYGGKIKRFEHANLFLVDKAIVIRNGLQSTTRHTC